MPVYFAYRSFDCAPTGKYLKRFEDDTVLDWFQRNWDHLAIEDSEEAYKRLTEVLGCNGWFLWNPFQFAAENGTARPDSEAALFDLLESCMEDGAFVGSPHALQLFTEEDGEGGAIFYFDGHFLEQSGGLAAYLLCEDWRLPSGQNDGPFAPAVPTMALPAGDGAGVTYVILLERMSKYPLDDLAEGYRIEGARLPDLARYLCCLPPDTADVEYPGRLREVQTLLLGEVGGAEPMEAAFRQAIREEPGDAVTWAAWSDWRQDRGEEAPGLGLLRAAFESLARAPGRRRGGLHRMGEGGRETIHSLIQVDDNLAQMCLDVSWDEEPYFSQWMLFDDLWASAYPDLANAVLRFARRWDVLSPDE